MSAAPFTIKRLSSEDRSGFSCGVDDLDRYFARTITQDVKRRLAAAYIAVDAATDEIAGFYTLASAGVPLVDLPPEAAKRLPRYPMVPAVLLGRLAVDTRYRGRKLGSALLVSAIRRAAATDIGIHAMIVDAKGEDARAFYTHYGFVQYGSDRDHLFAPMKTLLAALPD